MVTHSPAKRCTPVRFRPLPLCKPLPALKDGSRRASGSDANGKQAALKTATVSKPCGFESHRFRYVGRYRQVGDPWIRDGYQKRMEDMRTVSSLAGNEVWPAGLAGSNPVSSAEPRLQYMLARTEGYATGGC